MTIGRIPKVDPGATQPQDRKPSRPLAAPASRRPRPARIGAAQTVAARIRRRLQIDGRAAKPTTPASKSAADAAPASRQACASSNVIPGSGRQRSRIREGILATAGWRIHRVGKTGAKARKQSFAATVASAFGTTPGANDGRLEENGQWLEPVPAIQIERTACPPPRPRAIRVPRLRNRLAGQSRPNHPPLGPRTPAVL